MPFLMNTVIFFVQVISTLTSIYSFIVIAACLISWVNPDPYNPIVRFLNRATQPAFAFIRRHLPFTQIAGIDLSPIVLLLGIQFLNLVIIKTVMQIMPGF